jgi:cbb3-type cytochrome oxidase subunit 3
MNTGYSIGILICIITTIGVVYHLIRERAKKRRKEHEMMLPMLTTEEMEIKLVTYEFMGAEFPSLKKREPYIHPIRDVTEPIANLGGVTWQNFRVGDEKPTNIKRGYGGIYHPTQYTIYINTDNWSNLHFAKILIHESLHAVGFKHGAVMDAKVEELLKKVREGSKALQ